MEAAWDYGLLADSSYYQALATLADTTSNMVFILICSILGLMKFY